MQAIDMATKTLPPPPKKKYKFIPIFCILDILQELPSIDTGCYDTVSSDNILHYIDMAPAVQVGQPGVLVHLHDCHTIF